MTRVLLLLLMVLLQLGVEVLGCLTWWCKASGIGGGGGGKEEGIDAGSVVRSWRMGLRLGGVCAGRAGGGEIRR